MEPLTNAASPKSSQRTSLDSPNATSLPESVDGPAPLNSQDGQRICPSGPEAVPASRSPQRGSKKVKRTPDTSGPSFDALSPSAVLQRSLANRLRASLDVSGSPEYELTWKEWAMQSGPPICALPQSGRPTYDSASTGWLA